MRGGERYPSSLRAGGQWTSFISTGTDQVDLCLLRWQLVSVVFGEREFRLGRAC
jgi:hypothetical protein